MRVAEVASGRAGDKGSTLDLTLVARDAAAYRRLAGFLTAPLCADALGAPRAERYELPGLLALKYVVPEILGGGTYSSLRAGMHWQKAAIWILLDLELPGCGDAEGAQAAEGRAGSGGGGDRASAESRAAGGADRASAESQAAGGVDAPA